MYPCTTVTPDLPFNGYNYGPGMDAADAYMMFPPCLESRQKLDFFVWLLFSCYELVECCFTSTETVGLSGTGVQDGHLDFHTAPEFCCYEMIIGYSMCSFLPYGTGICYYPFMSLFIYFYYCFCPFFLSFFLLFLFSFFLFSFFNLLSIH